MATTKKATKTQEFITNSFEETRQLGEKLAKEIVETNVFALFGDLGAGKTTFSQGFAKGLGIEKVNSPSFIIVREYQLPSKMLYHVDLYRTNSLEEIKDLGILEIMNDKNNIVLIEWAEKMEELLPENRTEIHFEYIEEDKRKITVKAYGN